MKLLLVEDDAKVATAVTRGLRAEGFAVETASDGVDGLWMATQGAYDLIVLDIMLPGRNGYRVCADLRAEGVVVEHLGGIDDLPALVSDFRPDPRRRLGVLVTQVRGATEPYRYDTATCVGSRCHADGQKPDD